MSSAAVYVNQKIISGDGDLAKPFPKRSVKEVSSNRNIATLEHFSDAPHTMMINVPNGQVWKPRQSPFLFRVSIKVSDGVGGWIQQEQTHIGLELSEAKAQEPKAEKKIVVDEIAGNPLGLAVAYNAPSVCFSDVEVSLGGKTLSRTQHVAQIDSLLKRQKAKIYNTSIFPYLAPDYWTRHKLISRATLDVVPANDLVLLPYKDHCDPNLVGTETHDFLWVPDFGIFAQESLPAGQYTLRMSPEQANIIKKSFVQTLYPTRDQDYTVEFHDFKYYLTCEDTPDSVRGKTLLIDSVEQAIQFKPVLSSGDTMLSFDTPKNMIAAAVAWQGAKAFSAQHPKYSKTMFTATDGDDSQDIGSRDNLIKLDRYFMQLADGQLIPDKELRLRHGAKNLTQQLFFLNMINSGNILLDSPSEGPDSFEELGFYHYTTIREGVNCQGQTQVQFVLNDNGWADLGNNLPRCMFISFRKVVSQITYDANGSISTVIPWGLDK